MLCVPSCEMWILTLNDSWNAFLLFCSWNVILLYTYKGTSTKSWVSIGNILRSILYKEVQMDSKFGYPEFSLSPLLFREWFGLGEARDRKFSLRLVICQMELMLFSNQIGWNKWMFYNVLWTYKGPTMKFNYVVYKPGGQKWLGYLENQYKLFSIDLGNKVLK